MSTSFRYSLRFRIAAFFLTWILQAPLALSDIKDPVRDAGVLIAPKGEQAVRVKTARVIIADYGLLRRDFPSLNAKSDQEIDRWLLDNTAYVSEPQAGQSTVNSPIQVEKSPSGNHVTRTALRPESYNRAYVFKISNEGFIDIKGTGTLLPMQASHGNGLATTGEAIREFIYEKKVQQILEHGGLLNRTVGGYAVIDWGFDVLHADGSRDPAGAILRQAHERYSAQQRAGLNTFLDRDVAKQIEITLRKYGITSSGERVLGPQRDIINIQGNAKGEIVDFGSYLVRPEFKNPAFSYLDLPYVRGGLPVGPLLDPKMPNFPQPDPGLRLPFEVWGYSATGKADPKFDNIWVWSHELARNLRDGKAQRQDVTNHFNTMMNARIFDPAKAIPLPAPAACAVKFGAL